MSASETYLKNSPRILLYVENAFCRDLMTCTVIATASNFADSAIVLTHALPRGCRQLADRSHDTPCGHPTVQQFHPTGFTLNHPA
ncbi:Uncharacterized protein HZ326_21650 [Fusarium oxysporum f. sp. albedinis]|nr:Uncharacterized protein HZ326_21650 [Fusarium oxysporum f. sp. albedinis]